MNQHKTIQPKLLTVEHSEHLLLDSAIDRKEAFSCFLGGVSSRRSSVLVIINDSHRSTLTRAALQAFARYISHNRLDIKCSVLVATGTHKIKLVEQREFERSVFEGLDLRIKQIAWHDCDDENNLIQIGNFRFNRLVKDHTYLLPIGSVEPHYFAGYTGAHKTVTLGCLARSDIEKNHQHALSEASDILKLAGNPVYDGIMTMVSALICNGKQICSINQVVCGSSLIAADIGDLLKTLENLAPVAKRAFVHEIECSVDWLELHVPMPLGRSLYQADKALKNNHLAVRNGGGIVLVAPCPDGVGDAAFLNVLRGSNNYKEAISLIASDGYRLGDHKAVKLRYLTDPDCRDVRVAIVSPGLDDADAIAANLRPFEDVQKARQWLAETTTGSVDRGVVVHDAGFVVARPINQQAITSD